MAKGEVRTYETTYFDEELQLEQDLRIFVSGKYGVSIAINCGSFVIYAAVRSYIKNKKTKYFIAYPSVKTSKNEYKTKAYSFNTETSDNVLSAVMDCLEENNIDIEEIVE